MKKYEVLAILVLVVLIGLSLFYRMYRHDVKALSDFSAAYERFDQAPSAATLAELKTTAAVRISSLIKNDGELMGLELEIANLAETGAARDKRATAYARWKMLQ